MNWVVPKIWEGQDVWIIGGGPSVTKQFDIPNEVVDSVLNGSTPPSIYSPYMSALHNKHVIGVNVAFMIGDWIDMVFFGDKGFFLRYQDQLAQFPGIKVTCTHSGSKQDWIKFLPHDKEHVRGISTIPSKVSWNGNSGAAAINLAAHTGAKRIILLGFDMTLGENKMQHWHDIYQRGKIESQERLRKIPFDRYLTGFKQIASDAGKLGIEILNASPQSKIKEFKKFTLKELLWDNS